MVKLRYSYLLVWRKDFTVQTFFLTLEKYFLICEGNNLFHDLCFSLLDILSDPPVISPRELRCPAGAPRGASERQACGHSGLRSAEPEFEHLVSQEGHELAY